jgi:curved DNA-binding protein
LTISDYVGVSTNLPILGDTLNRPDYYEFLQISPNAEGETIHRVYRFLATRLHPDNPESGDVEKFVLLKQAYEVLSNPIRRAEYDAARNKEQSQPVPLCTTIDFMDDLQGELNRRLAVLALLYIHRRTNPYSPEVSLLEVEKRMGFPRDYLEFASWYLRNKGYITRADNSDFTLTVEGVDFVESQRANIPILNRLLANVTAPSATSGRGSKEVAASPTLAIAPDGNRALKSD